MISSNYGIFEQNILDYSSDVASRELLLTNKLCDEGRNIRHLAIEKMSLQIQVIEHIPISIDEKILFVLQLMELSHLEGATEIDKEIILKLLRLSINRYSAVGEHYRTRRILTG